MELQSVTSSDYKHRNTDELLVCVFPNLAIILSKVYTRRTSDSNYLTVMSFRCATLA